MVCPKLLMIGLLLLTSSVLVAADPLPDKDLALPPQVLDANGNWNGNGNGNGNGKDEAKEPEPLKDNSFFIEEAYNQEPGVVQHIFNWIGFWQNRDQVEGRQLNYKYTLEMPLGSERHQFSFDLPWTQFVEGPPGGPFDEQGGLQDINLNYRYQLLFEDEHGWRPAVAPRFTAVLPSGDKTRGLGNGQTGFQFLLPVSKMTERFAYHFNAGFTYTPDVTVQLADGIDSPGKNLLGYALGASIIWLVKNDFNLMLEWVAFWDDDVDEFGFHDRSFQMILNPGFRWAVYTADEIQFVLGAAVPIGLTEDTPNIGVFGYMSVEHRVKKEKKNGK